MKIQEIQKNRTEVLNMLDTMINFAYKGLPHMEYDALRVVRGFIYSQQKLDELKETSNDSE